METSTHADKLLDMGAIGCDELLKEIKIEMDDLAVGQTLLVTAYDPAAPLDIAIWCRTTGNKLVRILPDDSGNQFLIQKGK